MEGIAWGSQWQWGYNKHPFLSAWLAYLASFLGQATGWPVLLLAQLNVGVTFLAVWRLALHMMPPLQALMGTLLLEGVSFYNIRSDNFTPDSLQCSLWALLALWFYKALTTQQTKSWLMAGLISALAFLTKYQAILLFLPMLLLLIINPESRKSFKTRGFYLSLGLFAILISPHMIWLFQHEFISLNYALEMSSKYNEGAITWPHLFYPYNIIINSFGNTALLFLLLWPCYHCSKLTNSTQGNLSSKGITANRLHTFQWHFLLALGLGPWFLAFILCIVNGNYQPSRWTSPYFFLLGLICIKTINPELTKKQIGQFFLSLGLSTGLIWCITFGLLAYHNQHTNLSDSSLPNEEFSEKITHLWHEKYQTQLPYVIGSHYLVAAIVAYSPDKPIPYFGFNAKESSWVKKEDVRKQGGVIVLDHQNRYLWDQESLGASAIEKRIKKEFSDLGHFKTITLKRTCKNKKQIQIKVAFIPPSSYT